MRINPFLSCSLTTDIFLDLIIFSTLEFNDILFFDIIHSILSTSKKRNSQSKWNSNFHLNIFSQWSNNGPRYHLCNLYRIRYSHVVSGKRGPATAKSRWRSSICWYQWKQSCRYSRSSSPISRLFFCLIPPPVSPPFTSSYHLWILSRIPPRVSSTRINLSAWTTDTQHSRSASIFPPICSRLGRGKLLLFTDSTFLPFLELEWRLWTATSGYQSRSSRAIFVSLRFMGREVSSEVSSSGMLMRDWTSDTYEKRVETVGFRESG